MDGFDNVRFVRDFLKKALNLVAESKSNSPCPLLPAQMDILALEGINFGFKIESSRSESPIYRTEGTRILYRLSMEKLRSGPLGVLAAA